VAAAGACVGAFGSGTRFEAVEGQAATETSEAGYHASSLGTRVASELLGFVAGVAIPGVPVLIWGLSGGFDGPDELGMRGVVIAPAVLVALFTAPLGIYLAGYANDEHGSYWWTFLGTSLGVLAFFVGSPILGILAYELSSDALRPTSNVTHARIMLPTLEVTPDLAILGLGGSF
jgi:hypothetical protein